MIEIWQRSSYTDKSEDHRINQEIYEYDLKSAGLNIAIYYHLLPEEELQRLLSITSKKKRVVEIGLLQRSDPIFRKALSEGFQNARKIFFEANDLKEEDILSIKKDAIFTYRPCAYTEFDNLLFVCKNQYTSYHRYGKKYEHYFREGVLDIKGISDGKQERHKNFMVKFLKSLYRTMEMASSTKHIIKELMEFVYAYQMRELEPGYYRELNDMSQFLVLYEGQYQRMNECDNVDLLDTTFNYMKYLVGISTYYFRNPK